jgi:type I restriction enzyme S subunit
MSKPSTRSLGCIKLKYLSSINDEALPESTDPNWQLDYIDIGNVDSNGNIDTIAKYRFDEAPSRARRVVKEGDVIISTVRTYLQAITSIDFEIDNLIVSTGFAVVRPNVNIFNPRFCKYALRQSEFLAEVQSQSVGVSYPAINAADLGNIKIPVPSIETQEQIANYLDVELNRINDLIQAKESQLTLLSEKRQTLITQAVTKGLNPKVKLKDSGIDWLGEIPKHWGVKALKFECKFFNYKRIPLSSEERATHEKIYDYYGASGVIDKVGDYLFDGEYILVGEDGANLLSRSSPLAFKASGKFWVNNHAHILKPEFGNIDYWTFLLETFDYTIYVTGSAQPKLTIDNLANIRLPIPPVDEQNEISNFMNKEIALIDKIYSVTKSSIELLKERHSSIITAAVTGQLEIPL